MAVDGPARPARDGSDRQPFRPDVAPVVELTDEEVQLHAPSAQPYPWTPADEEAE